MPTAMTFNSLLSDVRSYLERGTSATQDPRVFEQLPKLINLAERRIARDLKIQGQIEVVSGTWNAGVYVQKKPERWRETVAISVGTGTTQENYTPVNARGLEFMRAFCPNPATRGQPRYYGDYNYENWLVVPTPDKNYPVEIVFYALPALLDETNQTNWATEYMPDALLYGTLLGAAPFLMNDERIPIWKQFYAESIGSVDSEDQRRMADRAATRQED